MLGLSTKHIGGFKVAIGRKVNYGYQITAIVLVCSLLALVIYDILYASQSLTSVFNERVQVEPNNRRFNLGAAENNPKLNGASSVVQEIQSLEEIFPDLVTSPPVSTSTTPALSPTPR